MACIEKNPLNREGTSIVNRVLDALSVNYARADERQAADIMLFLQRYAKQLRYHKSSGGEEGTWEPLMTIDISVTLAVLMQIDTLSGSDYKKQLYKRIKQTLQPTEAKRSLKYVFDLLFSLTKIVVTQYYLLPTSFEYRQQIRNIVQAKIIGPVANLKDLFDKFMAAGLIDNSVNTDSHSPVHTTSSHDYNNNQLGTEWTLPAAVQGLGLPATGGPKKKIETIIDHNFFNAQVEAVLNAVAAIGKKAEALFNTTLNNYPSHTPHYALVIAFLKLFKHAQDELNTYTKKHLDFYYKEGLQLKNKKAEADNVHLLFELQKPVSKHLLKVGEIFKSNKDAISGKELQYALTEEVVFNKAVIEKVQSLVFLQSPEAKETLYASPTAASEDGQGAKLTSTDKSWFTFGKPAAVKHAPVGFAIASNQLFLSEGTRTVTLTINFAEGTNRFAEVLPEPHTDFFTGKLTGLKDWHDVVINSIANTDGDQLTLSFTLSPSDPAIIPYTEAIHKENMEMDLPLLKVYLDQSVSNSYAYRMLSNDSIASIAITVEVSGVKELVLSNDIAAIDASKPFMPFGNFPHSGSSFYIGSNEVFQKKLTGIKFSFENEIPYTKEIFNLQDGAWTEITGTELSSDTFSLNTSFKKAAVRFSKSTPLAITSLDGFIKLTLGVDGFSKESYLTAVQTQINDTTLTQSSSNPLVFDISSAPIASPKELILDGFSIDYEATSVINLAADEKNNYNRFLHITPFGYYEMKFDAAIPSKIIPLVSEIENNGELFIGVSNTEPEEVLNILFHVAAGSSNPLKDSEPVSWYFLNAQNTWQAFEKRNVIDRTLDLSQSGIVTLTLPLTISNQCTALQKGLYWIKAAVQKNPDSVCKMILVQAQAAQVKLIQDEINNIEFRQVLPAGTVSKLLNTASEIKSISQPFDSFGGRAKETDEHFYVRVSERLRHKQKAITIWDYEHMILEQFPEISKVRCINHSGFYKGADDKDIFCENFPGHVSIITIPDFRGRSGINPLRPYTPVGTRKNIDAFIREHCSPFVKLHVKNPQFEEVQFEFNVTFHENLDASFYEQLLSKEIEKYLTPWAYDANSEISFGGRIIKSQVLNFVEERSYVDYVTDFKMHHIINREDKNNIIHDPNIEVAAPTTARSLLVSYYNEETKVTHIINSPATCPG